MNISYKSIFFTVVFGFVGTVGFSQNSAPVQNMEKKEIKEETMTAVEVEQRKAVQLKQEEEEEQEMMKVAITRAAKKLTLVEPKKD